MYIRKNCISSEILVKLPKSIGLEILGKIGISAKKIAKIPKSRGLEILRKNCISAKKNS